MLFMYFMVIFRVAVNGYKKGNREKRKHKNRFSRLGGGGELKNSVF